MSPLHSHLSGSSGLLSPLTPERVDEIPAYPHHVILPEELDKSPELRRYLLNLHRFERYIPKGPIYVEPCNVEIPGEDVAASFITMAVQLDLDNLYEKMHERSLQAKFCLDRRVAFLEKYFEGVKVSDFTPRQEKFCRHAADPPSDYMVVSKISPYDLQIKVVVRYNVEEKSHFTYSRMTAVELALYSDDPSI